MVVFLRVFMQPARKEVDDNPLPQSASVLNDIMDNLMMGAHQNYYGTKRVSKESSDVDAVPTDSTRVEFELAVNNELSTPAHGLAAVGGTHEDYDSGSPLFTPSPPRESDGSTA